MIPRTQIPQQLALEQIAADELTVDPETGCWTTNFKPSNTDGYVQRTGNIGGTRKTVLQHRLYFAAEFGEMAAALTLDHLCRDRACCNPQHLEAVDQRTNVLRGEGQAAKHAAATHCPQGHAYVGENLYLPPRGGRACRACVREAGAQYRAKRRTTA